MLQTDYLLSEPPGALLNPVEILKVELKTKIRVLLIFFFFWVLLIFIFVHVFAYLPFLEDFLFFSSFVFSVLSFVSTFKYSL